MNVDLTKMQIEALLYATGNFTQYEGTGDPVRDGCLERAEAKLKAALDGEPMARKLHSLGEGGPLARKGGKC